jgi:hypothetical protein
LFILEGGLEVIGLVWVLGGLSEKFGHSDPRALILALGGFALDDLERDGAVVRVVRDEARVAELINDRFAAACEVVLSVQESAGNAFNAHNKARCASCRRFMPLVQCSPMVRFRLGVR